MIKEIGDPLSVGHYLQLDRKDLKARIVMAQGRQNTNYAINLYACHPFFCSGICHNDQRRKTPLFNPYQGILVHPADFQDIPVTSQIPWFFTHILHYVISKLGFGIDAYKHIITPLQDQSIATHPNSSFLKHLKHSCRRLIIDGPNCVIGSLPDHSLFMVQDRKKLRPGVVGGRPGMYAFSSEICGLDAVIPDRDPSRDFQPMYLDTAIVGPNRQEIKICRQTNPLDLSN